MTDVVEFKAWWQRIPYVIRISLFRYKNQYNPDLQWRVTLEDLPSIEFDFAIRRQTLVGEETVLIAPTEYDSCVSISLQGISKHRRSRK